MNRDEIRELAAVYALGAADGEDRARFEALLDAGDPEALAALREFQDTMVGLAASAPDPAPPRSRAALMERAAAAERPRLVAVGTARARRSWWPAVWAGAAAASIAAIAVGLAVSTTYERRLEALSRETATLRGELQRQQATLALLRDPTTQVVTLAGLEPAPAARARMLWNPPAGGLFVAAGLPQAPEGKAYQLWAIAGKNAPVSAGVFGVDPRGSASVPVPPLPGVAGVDVFAVTLEPAGGLPAPSGPMYLAGKSS
jgi:anti-sigma-K factor RskA